MTYFFRIFCFLRGIVRTISCGTWIQGNTVSGHDFVEQEPEEGQPGCLQIMRCSTCGDYSIGWYSTAERGQ